MSRTEILTEIKKEEAKADAKVIEAEEQQKATLAETRRDSVKKIQDAEAQMRSSYESAIAREKTELNLKHDKVIVEGERDADSILSRSSAKKQEAKDFLKEEIERILNVTS